MEKRPLSIPFIVKPLHSCHFDTRKVVDTPKA